MKSQVKFAVNIAKNKLNVSHSNSESEGLTLSNEMKSWLHNSINNVDDDGYLVETVSSTLAQPLDSFSAFCPTGSLLNSKYSSLRVPSPTRVSKTNDVDYETNLIKGKPPSPVNFSSAVDRLNVMWLSRKSALQKESGDLTESYNTLQKALDIHLGHNHYTNVTLTECAGAENPDALIIELEENYFAYDSSAHRYADKIQRWYHTFYLKKCRAMLKIAICYQRYITRRRNWLFRQMLAECCLKIQRQFRKFLNKLYHFANRIKDWYKTRCCIREFRKKIFFYIMARHIQRLFRGYGGRNIGNMKRLQKKCAQKIQRLARGYILRRTRAFAIKQFHRVYYKAAVKIQCFVRKVLSIGRCKHRLMRELIKEDERLQREDEVHDETIQIEISRVKLYLKTDAGKLHLTKTKQKIVAEDEEFERLKPSLNESEIMTREALVMFELFDCDGSGTIDRGELKLMLIELCISLKPSEVDALANELDLDGSGDIDFAEFSSWYCTSSDSVSNSFGSAMFRQILKARRLFLDLSGKTIERRTERSVLRQCCSWLSTETKSLFRVTCPPKYNCCRCIKPFVLFTDYWSHFIGKEKRCPITKERGIFYPKFWHQEDWKKQRQCEIEILRVRDEYPCLSYKALIAVYSELVLQNNSGVNDILNTQIDAASELYLGQLLDCKTSSSVIDMSYSIPLGDIIFDIANICNDGYLSPNVVTCICECLDCPTPIEWVINDRWILDELHQWLLSHERLTRPMLPQSKNMMFKCIPKPLAKILKADSRLLGNIMVKCIRILLVGAENSLVALAHYRAKRPRKILISDEELATRGLPELSKISYDGVKQKLVRRLGILKEALQKIYKLSINIRKQLSARSTISKFSYYCKEKLGLEYTPLSLDEDEPSAEDIVDFEIGDAHARATAYFYSRLKTRVGKVHLHRVACELWAERKRRIYDRISSDGPPANEYILWLNYVYSLFISTDQGISIHDLPTLFSHYLCLKIPSSELPDIISSLNYTHSGFVSFDTVLSWIEGESSKKYYSRIMYLAMKCRSFSFVSDAKVKILSEMLTKARLDLEVQKDSLKNICVDRKMSKKQKKEYELEMQMMSERQAKLLQFNKEFADREQAVLTRISEDDAEFNCKLFLLLSSRGRYFLGVERELLRMAQVTINVYASSIGYTNMTSTNCLEDSNSILDYGKSLCLRVLVNCFDTDCSGTFDEGEVTLLLRCLKNALSEKEILYHFPSIVATNSASGESIVSFLMNSIHLKVGGICFERVKYFNTRSFYYSSALLLISLARQAARDRATQASELTTTGILIKEDQDQKIKISTVMSNINGLLTRSQLLAMRQVHMFRQSHFGRLRESLTRTRLEILFENVISDAGSNVSILTYAFHLHKISPTSSLENSSEDHKILNTEVPHLLSYLKSIFHWHIHDSHGRVIMNLLKVDNRESVVSWLSLEDILEIFGKFVDLSSCENLKKDMNKSDAEFRMLSVARQEACVIALDLPDKCVKETNYRCFVLGLELFMKVKIPKKDVTTAFVNWNSIPEVALQIYLLSQGFGYNDLVNLTLEVERLRKLSIDVENNLSCFELTTDVSFKLINPSVKLEEIMTDLFTKYNCSQTISWLWRYAVNGALFFLYKKIVKILLFQKEEVNYVGRVFLNEIMIGISHSSFE